jgi:hypothetical protein
LLYYDNPEPRVVISTGVYFMNANIEHEVTVVTEGVRFSMVCYHKHVTKDAKLERVSASGYPLPTRIMDIPMPSFASLPLSTVSSLASISVAQDLSIFMRY